MLESDSNETSTPQTDDAQPAPARKRAARKRATKTAAAPAQDAAPTGTGDPTAGSAQPGVAPSVDAGEGPAAPRKRAARKATKAAATGAATPDADATDADAAAPRKAAAKKTTRARKATAAPATDDAATAPAAPDTQGATGDTGAAESGGAEPAKAAKATRKRAARKSTAAGADADAAEPTPGESGPTAPGVLFQAPAGDPPPRRRAAAKKAAAQLDSQVEVETSDTGGGEAASDVADPDDIREAAVEQAAGARRRRRRGRRGRGGSGTGESTGDAADDAAGDAAADTTGDDAATAGADTAARGRQAAGAKDGESADTDATEGEGSTSTRRRRRRRSGGNASDGGGNDDPPNTVTHVRDKRDDSGGADDGVRGVKGSTRLEAKRQRRRDGRDTSRRRAPILTEAEFLARREAVDRVMAVRQNGERTQIAVLEDDILVEHYVTRASSTSYVGNVYLGRVQNVLPSMEAAFVDIGKGRNGVLYAGEVNWDAAGLEGKSRAIENAMKSGDAVLVQVTKDPIGHKGARLTSQVSLPGRYLVYVPNGAMTGISRRLPDTERHRLKTILKKIVPEDAGVIVRTAAEGASEEDLTRDVERLTAQWAAIEEARKKGGGGAPKLVHGEPDLAIRVVRDVFNEDFKSLVVQGDDAWETVSEYIGAVTPDLAERVSKHTAETDLFHDLRVDEQLMKALDRKVWLPSGGSLVIDRTEAMTVIDVNTGKFVGSGGNLEQTVTRNNIEAAEEIVRQLRLRDVGGIVVIDFIDMVLASNRELVLRRLTECLGRDRTKHQVAEVTSLGLVQMTRKRVGEGLLEAFSEPCEVCKGRGIIVHGEPVDQSGADDDARGNGNSKQSKRRRGGRGANGSNGAERTNAEIAADPGATSEQRMAANAAIAAIHRAAAGGAEPGDDADGPLAELATDLVAAAMDPAAADADAAPPVNGSAVERPAAESAAPEPTTEPATELATEPATEPTTEPADDAADAATPAPARRRRRAASRPAGPPVPTT